MKKFMILAMIALIPSATKTESWTATATLQGHTKALTSAVFNHDGTQIVTASADGTAIIWTRNGNTWTKTATLQGHTKALTSAAFNYNGTQIVTASVDSTAIVWTHRGNTWTKTATLQGHIYAVQSAAFNHDGTKIVTACADGTAIVWTHNGDTWIKTATLQHKGALLNTEVRSAAFNHDSTQIVTASYDYTAKVWKFKNGSWIKTAVLQGHTDFVQSAVFNHDSTQIVTASNDNTVKVWEFKDGKWRNAATLRDPTADSELLLNIVYSAVFNHDGTKIVAAFNAGTVIVWEFKGGSWTNTATLNQEISAHSAAFNYNDTQIVTAYFDGTAKVWDFHPEKAAAELAATEKAAAQKAASELEKATIALSAAKKATAEKAAAALAAAKKNASAQALFITKFDSAMQRYLILGSITLDDSPEALTIRLAYDQIKNHRKSLANIRTLHNALIPEIDAALTANINDENIIEPIIKKFDNVQRKIDDLSAMLSDNILFTDQDMLTEIAKHMVEIHASRTDILTIVDYLPEDAFEHRLIPLPGKPKKHGVTWINSPSHGKELQLHSLEYLKEEFKNQPSSQELLRFK